MGHWSLQGYTIWFSHFLCVLSTPPWGLLWAQEIDNQVENVVPVMYSLQQSQHGDVMWMCTGCVLDFICLKVRFPQSHIKNGSAGHTESYASLTEWPEQNGQLFPSQRILLSLHRKQGDISFSCKIISKTVKYFWENWYKFQFSVHKIIVKWFTLFPECLDS